MIKVVIADDEPVIRNGIAKVIPWEKYGCEIAGVARNGEEALQYVKESGARIIISDIKMPKMNGLELLSRIREMESEIFFIIVSGYDEFQYVQKALNQGAYGYLLKPIVPEELEEMLHRAIEKINDGDEREAVPMLEKEERLLERDSLYWIPAYLDGTLKQEKFAWEEQRRYGMLLVHELGKEEEKKSIGPEQMLQMLETMLTEHFSNGENVIFMRKNSLIYIVLVETEDETLEKQIKLFQRHWMEEFKDLEFAIAISEVSEEWKALHALAGEVQRIARYQLYTGVKLLTDQGLKNIWKEQQKRLGFSFADARDLILANEKEKLLGKMRQMVEGRTWEDSHALIEAVLFWCYEACVLGEQEYSDFRPEWLRLEKECFSSTKRVDELLKRLKKSLDEIFVYLDRICSKNMQMMVERAKAIARLDYGDSNLSLSLVARRLGFNAAYFSRVFSLTAQQGFAEFLTNIRIEKSKELLLTDMKVQNIAQCVGYNNQPYFSTRFRAETGLTPSQYREKYYNYLDL